MILMGLGPFRFSVSTYSVEELERRASYRWQGQDVIGARPVQQWLGPGEETVDMTSTMHPYSGFNGGGLAQLEGLRQAGLDGRVMILVSGSGRVFGRWSIRDLGETRSLFLQNGEPQTVEVDMTLVAHGAERSAGGGGLLSLFG